jgi:predicted nucleic acid-binding protein
MFKVFFDTDVVLDAFIEREPFHQTALHLFTFVERGVIKGCTSPVVIANTYYMLAKIKDGQFALKKVQFLLDIITITQADGVILQKAASRPGKDFEDSIQFFCALTAKASCLVTRNTRDFLGSENLMIMDPAQCIAAVHEAIRSS